MPKQPRSSKVPKPERRKRCLAKLGVQVAKVESQPQITPILRRAGLARRDVVDYLALSSEPDARKFMETYNSLNTYNLDVMTLEALAVGAGLTTTRLFELIAGAVFSQSKFEAALMAAFAHPRVVRRTIERALEEPQVVKLADGGEKVLEAPSGVADRKMLHQQAGFLPMPKTQIVSLPGVKSIDARQTANVILPPMEMAVRRMADRFGEKLLPPAPNVEAEEGLGEAPDPDYEVEE